MIYIISWLLILTCVVITFLAVGVFLVNRNPDSKFVSWWEENIINRDPEDKFFD